MIAIALDLRQLESNQHGRFDYGHDNDKARKYKHIVERPHPSPASNQGLLSKQ